MSITSISFALFLCIVFILYYTVFAGKRQWICLLLASTASYVFSGPKNLVFLVLTALTCWGSALWMERWTLAYKSFRAAQKSDNPEKADGNGTSEYFSGMTVREAKAAAQKRKRDILLLALLLNFGVLALVKYWGVSYHGWLLPLGMSFYTFQALGYLIDVYNGKIRAERNFLHYFLFVSFFPQLVQGPIGRYDQLQTQLLGEHKASFEQWKRAMLLILFGLMKKYAIANVLAPAIAVLLDDNIRTIPGSAVVFAILMYSFQQYADFSGGIDIVTGAAQLFGIELAPNFRQPYFSISLGDFWRRWHISLGAWMRDYVFYPFALLKPVQKLGKKISKRFGKHLGVVLPASIANILVFFLVGIWHGPEVHYILWGLYNGIVIALSDIGAPLFHSWNEKLHLKTESRGMHLFRVARTFVIVNIGWYFDRIYQFGDCMHAFAATFVPERFQLAELGTVIRCYLTEPGILTGKGMLLVLLGMLVLLAADLLHEQKRTFYDVLAIRPRAVRWCCLYALMLLVQLAIDFSNVSSAFMYANF